MAALHCIICLLCQRTSPWNSGKTCNRWADACWIEAVMLDHWMLTRWAESFSACCIKWWLESYRNDSGKVTGSSHQSCTNNGKLGWSWVVLSIDSLLCGTQYVSKPISTDPSAKSRVDAFNLLEPNPGPILSPEWHRYYLSLFDAQSQEMTCVCFACTQWSRRLQFNIDRASVRRLWSHL